MEFKIKASCVLTIEHNSGNKTSKHIHTDFNLNVSDNMDWTLYLDEEGLPTAAGTKALTQCFVQGIIGNIHYAHEKGYRNDAEHLRYIISELERGFIENTTIEKGNLD